MTKIAMVFIGMGVVSVPFAPDAQADMASADSPASSEIGSSEARGATKAGETDITNTKRPG
jgi:hypothetical protein